MSIEIDWHKIPTTKQDEEDRYFPRIKSSHTVTDKELFKKASGKTVFTRATFGPAVYELARVIAEMLSQGNAVSLQDLGIFRLQFGTEHSITSNQRTDTKAIKVKGVSFTPSEELMKVLQETEFKWTPERITHSYLTDEEIIARLQIWFATHSSITRQQFSDLFLLRRSTATKRINSLIHSDILTKHGNNRQTHYTLNSMYVGENPPT